MGSNDIFWSPEWWGLVQGSISTGSPVGQSAMGWPRWLRRVACSIFTYGLNSESLKVVFRFTPGHFYIVCHVLRLIVIDLYLCKPQWLLIQTSNSTVPIAKNFIFTLTFKPWTCQKIPISLRGSKEAFHWIHYLSPGSSQVISATEKKCTTFVSNVYVFSFQLISPESTSDSKDFVQLLH